MSVAAGPKNALKIEYMQPFVDSLKSLFEQHLKGTLKIDKMRMNESGTTQYDLSAVIAFTGTVVGRAVISMPTEVAEKAAAAYLQMDPVPEEAVPDCVGEMANIIVGRAKAHLENHQIVISPPTVVKGRDYSITPQRDAACISIPCQSDYGPLQLDISIVENELLGAKL